METAFSRRGFLATAAVGAAGVNLPSSFNSAKAEEKPGNLSIAPFRFDVTPPNGHPLCGGWITPAQAVDDSLEAIGFVLLGAGKPIVICAVDWTGLLNEAHVAWRTAMAEAAGTTPDRVAVQCVHQHNAPFACLDAQKIVAAQGDLPDIVQIDFFRRCLDRARSAVSQAIPKARKVTHLANGQGRVDKVAANRRVNRDANGNVLSMRGSSSKDEKLRALPEGLIDPFLKTVAFYDGDKPVVALHYYATHPMSYYGDGRISSDFAGLARKQRQQDDTECTHIYFTGCAGNVAAGKYNDGTKPLRPILTKRILDGILASEKRLKPEPIGSIEWKTEQIMPKARPDVAAKTMADQINNKENRVVGRNRPAYQLAWIERAQKQAPPIILSALNVNDTSLLHLPAESFVEYQLRAQEVGKGRFVATAAYGDGGPWYIPTLEEYPKGGYEVSVAYCDPEIDKLLTDGMKSLLN